MAQVASVCLALMTWTVVAWRKITSKPGFLTNIVARFSGAALRDGQLQLPFRIGGTIDNPVFFQRYGRRGA